MDVALHVTVEVGRARMTIQDLLQLGQGSVLELAKLAGESLDIYVNGKPMAKGEAVIVNEKFGVRLTEIVSQEDRIESLA
jgi:flagellar motor switch protein FliN/FliY